LITTRQVRSSSRSGVYHDVTYRDGVPESCGCESFTHRGYCRHVGHRPAEQPGGLQTNSFGLIRIRPCRSGPPPAGDQHEDRRDQHADRDQPDRVGGPGCGQVAARREDHHADPEAMNVPAAAGKGARLPSLASGKLSRASLMFGFTLATGCPRAAVGHSSGATGLKDSGGPGPTCNGPQEGRLRGRTGLVTV
jgi:hypothetical protein